MTDHIELTETTRLRIEPDDSPTCPRGGDEAMVTGFVKIRGMGDSRLMDVPAVHEDPTGRITEAHDHFDNANLGYDMIDPEPVVQRWAYIFHDLHVEYDAEHGGYWFVDPDESAENWPGPDYPEGRTKREQEAALIAQEQETYRQWADGEVYGVILERKTLWQRADYPDTTMETWDEIESVWGCYLDDEYTAQIVAEEYFDLDDAEEAALGLS